MDQDLPFRLEDSPTIKAPFRLQWEEAQNAYVMLFPEGIIQLNETGGVILNLCTGEKTVTEIIQHLETLYEESDLKDNICRFLKVSYEKGWIET